MKIKRITIDLDTRNILVKWYSFTVLTINGFRHIKINNSASGRGFHLIGWHEIGYEIQDLLKIRLYACDDKARLYFDSQKSRHINILFDSKRVFIYQNRNELIRSVQKWKMSKKLK